MVLGRDHLGIKPLFYSVTDEGLFFGSEIKAVLAGSGSAPRLRPASLQEYLVFRYVAGSRSFFDGVHRLPPGHVAVWQDGGLHVRRYWSAPAPVAGNGATVITLKQASDRLEALLEEAVRSQLMSEVPLGTFCSGGVDSGLVTTYAARHADRQLSTFSVGFAERMWDETALAQDTADIRALVRGNRERTESREVLCAGRDASGRKTARERDPVERRAELP